MVNCNPETVSTDYDTSDRLFFEPLTEEDVLNVCERAAGRATGGQLARRDRRPRRADAAEARAGSSSSAGHPGARHQPGVDRRRRGPRAVQRAVRPPRHPAARGRDGELGRRAVAVANERRLSGARAAVVRARRPRDADRLRRRRPAARDGRARAHGLARTRRRALGRTARADRPLPRGRGRGRRRRAPRPHRRRRDRRR